MKVFFDNKEEIIIGFLAGNLFTAGIVGDWSVLVGLATAALWRIGGYKSKGARRYGVPSLICIAGALGAQSWIPLLSIPAGVAVLSMGYGIPDRWDDGSALGKFWYRYTPDPRTLTILTRGTVGLLFGLAMCSLAFISPLTWLAATVIFAVAYPLIVLYVV